MIAVSVMKKLVTVKFNLMKVVMLVKFRNNSSPYHLFFNKKLSLTLHDEGPYHIEARDLSIC